MTTTTTSISDVQSSLLPPSLFNIQYPNCNRGMYSLRQPFKDMPTAVVPTEPRKISSRKATPAPVVDEEPPQQDIEPEPLPPRQASKRNAEVQCLLLTPNTRHDMAVQTKLDRQPIAVNDNNDITPQYRQQRQFEQYQKVYEIWCVETPPIQRREPQVKQIRNRKPIIDYDNEEEVSDYDDERIIYARQPRRTIKKTYLPSNVRMICVRNDTNRDSY